ncbi:MAG: hypothetical protein A2Z14_15755 [Chloroflexi bacterium RBG_16_48_8]|nr:MAG: hypothetical protein A2Z14_15755 [Chloroflexi bacterium RBG_16_48_8]
MPNPPLSRFQAFWVRIWMSSVLIGLFLFVIGIYPNLIHMDRSPVVGFVQVGVWLFGLAMILFGAYAALHILRNKLALSLRAEIGERLIATGYVVAAAASLADFIGIGSHEIPDLIFGPIQIIGLIVGIVTALIGIGLYWPRRHPQQAQTIETDPTNHLEKKEEMEREG